MENIERSNPENQNNLSQEIIEKIPAIDKWVDNLLEEHKDESISVNDLDFNNLDKFFSSYALENSRVVFVDKVPQIPLASKFGIEELKDFESMNIAGATFDNTYFVDNNFSDYEGLHVHELCHKSADIYGACSVAE